MNNLEGYSLLGSFVIHDFPIPRKTDKNQAWVVFLLAIMDQWKISKTKLKALISLSFLHQMFPLQDFLQKAGLMTKCEQEKKCIIYVQYVYDVVCICIYIYIHMMCIYICIYMMCAYIYMYICGVYIHNHYCIYHYQILYTYHYTYHIQTSLL